MNTEIKEETNLEKYKWWVTPINLLVISGFLVVIDLVTGNPQGSLEWVQWPAIGLMLIYAMNVIVVKKPEMAWFVGPAFFLFLAIFLLILDLVYGPNEGLLFTDWALIPVGALLAFGTIIPVIVHLGKRKKPPRMRLEEFKQKMQIQEDTDVEKE